MILLIFQALFGLLVLLFTYLIVKPLTVLILLKIKHGKDIHCEFMPILGQMFYDMRAFTIHRDSAYYRRKTIERNPGIKFVATNFILDKINITIVDPQLSKQFLQAPEQYKKFDLLLFSDLTVSEGLFFTEDQQWKDQRKIIGQQFTFENLKSRIPLIKNITKQIFSEFIKIDEDIKLLELTQKITGEVITQSFFGEEFSNQLVNGKNVTDATVECVAIQFELTMERTWTHVRGSFFGYKSNIPEFLLTQEEKLFLIKLRNLIAFVKSGIAQRECDFELNQKKLNQDFIQIYLSESRKQNKPFSKDELLHQFITFAFAGTDTTSTLTSMACYILSAMPDLQEELRIHVKEHVNSFEELSHQDLPKLDKLNALFLEVMRIWPPVDQLFPRYARQQHKIGNFTMKPSYLIDCGILQIQQNSQFYQKPLEFNINRWLNNDLKDPHAFIAFSSGPRNCIGQHMALAEAKIMLTYLLMNYKMIPDPKRKFEMNVRPLYAPADDRLVHFQLL